ncbi:TonB-dependent receptor plug domain-containing protein [Desulfuromonas sp. AOP6]|uniref:TonB-dependent receptor plug domain-containing protein n=1 Tax=Desulfuromonas sp. AOP6 TaxID=1566351 RepID=UPI001BD1B362|nr:TonB-dependent receptor plug domain-containing protein [Desulfuromonas sp. AOP6]
MRVLKASVSLCFGLFCLLVVGVSALWAEADEKSFASGENISELARVTVVGVAEVPVEAGTTTLNSDLLENLPSGDGTLTEQLRILPGIQYSEEANSSLTGGEIVPPKISISGGRPYDNNFQIDGLGNNSLLDPEFSSTDNLTNIAGHSQELFLSPRLLESVTVHRSNVSARYGGFTGGVVEADTRNPAKEFGGNLYYRTTRSAWTEFHLDPASVEEFTQSTSEEMQPRFAKHEGGFSLDLPINQRMGLLVAYQQAYSSINLTNLTEDKKQYRKNENFFIKYALEISPETRLSLTATHAPYAADYFLENTKNSDYSIKGGGSGFSGAIETAFPGGWLEVNLGYRNSKNARSAPPNYFMWAITQPTKDWGTLVNDKFFSKEGGFGSIENKMQTWEGNAHINLDPVRIWGFTHKVGSGLGFINNRAEFDRPFTTTHYLPFAFVSSEVVCPDGQIDCVDGEQFFYKKRVYEQDHTEATLNQVFWYGEDEIEFGKIVFRPGLHISYNDYLENWDAGHRLLLKVDALGQGKTLLFGGINRYYGQTFLSHKLAAGKKPLQSWTRSTVLDENLNPQEWELQPPTVISGTRVSDLDTPYVDEWTVGFDQAVLGGRLLGEYLERKGRDLLAITSSPKDENNYQYIEWNNNGRSFHQEASLTWERWWGKDYVNFNVTWQDSVSSNDSYTDRLEDDDAYEKVLYNGDVIFDWELPREDFNRPWVGNLTLVKTLPAGFTFTNVTKYRSGYVGLKDVDLPEWAPEENIADAYEDVNRPSSTIFDWKISWQTAVSDQQTLVFNLEAYNVFDKKVYVADAGDEYELGRQIWAGIEYLF